MTHPHALPDAPHPPPLNRPTTPYLLSSLGYGIGVLAFLFWPMLIPGTGFQLAVLESTGIALAGYLAICLYGLYVCLRNAVRRNASIRRRNRRSD